MVYWIMLNVIIAAHKGRQRLVNVCVSRKYVDEISQNLQSLSSYQSDPPILFSLMILKSNHWVSRYQRVSRYLPISVNQSILSNRSVEFHLIFFCFLMIQHNVLFSTHVRRICLSNKGKTDPCAVASCNC